MADAATVTKSDGHYLSLGTFFFFLTALKQTALDRILSLSNLKLKEAARVITQLCDYAVYYPHRQVIKTLCIGVRSLQRACYQLCGSVR